MTFPAPAAAYRADLKGRTEPLGSQDDRWLAAASELHLAAGARDAAGGADHRREAVRIATDLVGADRVEAYVRREWLGERSSVDALLLLADTMYYGRALHLGAVLLGDVPRGTPDIGDVHRGRVVYRLARISWALGDLEGARERYEYLGELGRQAGSDELRALSGFGLLTMAQFRGDFPEVRRRLTRSRSLAERSGNPALVRMALLGVVMGNASAGKFDEAVIAGWRLLALSKGHPIWETEALINLGQLMMEMGRPDRARAAFAAAVELAAPARLLVPALGGLAVSSALAGREPTVEWTVREVWRAQDLSVEPYTVAVAHLECAVALRALGRAAEAGRHLRAAEEMARRFRFHEVSFRAAELESAPVERRFAPLAREAEEVTERLAAMEPERLPSALAFDTAPV